MRNVIFLFLMVVSYIHAQDVNTIRKAYSEVKNNIAMQHEINEMKNNCKITLVHNVPGIGTQEVTYSLYFSAVENDADGNPMLPKLRYAQCSFNVAARKMYEEYLYSKDGSLMFVYYKYDDIDSDAGFIEKRIYMNRDGSFIKVKINNKKDVIYNGDGRDCDNTYIENVSDTANKILEMYRAINSCIRD